MIATVLALLQFAALATSGDWPMYRHDFNNSGAVPGPARGSPLSLSVRWRFHADTRISSAATTASSLVFIGTWRGDVVAINAADGKPRWTAHLGANNDWVYGGPRGVLGSITIANGVAYAVSGNCVAAAFDAVSGHELWRRTICDIKRNDDAYASPVVVSGLVLFGINILVDRATDRGREIALDAKTGAVRWTLYPQRYQGMGSGISATPAIDARSGVAYLGTGNPTPMTNPPPGPDPGSDSIIAFDVATGHVRWMYGPVHPHDTNDMDLFGSPNRFAVGAGSNMRWIIGEGCKDGTYYAADARTGREVWRRAVMPGVMIIATATVGKGTTFVPAFASDASGSISALRATDGAIVWQRSTGGEYESPVLWGDVLFITESAGWLDAFAAGSGKQLGRWKLSGKAMGRGPTIANGTLYVAAGNDLTAFRLPSRSGCLCVNAAGEVTVHDAFDRHHVGRGAQRDLVLLPHIPDDIEVFAQHLA